MSDDRSPISPALARHLVDSQFPHWTALEIRRVDLDGWSNSTFRLGDQLKLRFPTAVRYVSQVEKEHRILPRLAPALPLPIPAQIALGRPDAHYPFPWSIYDWLDGDTALQGVIHAPAQFAIDLAGFLSTLQQLPTDDGPPPGAHNFFRGGALAFYDAETQDCLHALRDRIDAAAAQDVWRQALATTWQAPPVWLHGDVSAANLLVANGRLSAVIDFGSTAIGDPACDLVIAWTFLDGEARETFRHAIPADAATWQRARGWALWKSLLTLAKAPDDPANAARELKLITTLIDEHALSA